MPAPEFAIISSSPLPARALEKMTQFCLRKQIGIPLGMGNNYYLDRNSRRNEAVQAIPLQLQSPLRLEALPTQIPLVLRKTNPNLINFCSKDSNFRVNCGINSIREEPWTEGEYKEEIDLPFVESILKLVKVVHKPVLSALTSAVVLSFIPRFGFPPVLEALVTVPFGTNILYMAYIAFFWTIKHTQFRPSTLPRWLKQELIIFNFGSHLINTKGWGYFFKQFSKLVYPYNGWSVFLPVLARALQEKLYGIANKLSWIAAFANIIRWICILIGFFGEPRCIDKVTTSNFGGLSNFLPEIILALLWCLDSFIIGYSNKMDKSDEKNAKQFRWDIERDQCLLGWLVDEVKKGEQLGKTFKKTVHVRAARAVSEKFETICTADNVANRLKTHRKNFALVNKLKDESGFNWDGSQKMLVVDEQVYKNYIMSFPKHKKWLNRKIEMFDELAIVLVEDQTRRSFGKSFVDLNDEAEKIKENGNSEDEILLNEMGIKDIEEEDVNNLQT